MTKNISNRIDKKFKDLKEKKDNALICYVVAGYPDIKTSENIIVALIEGGADMIEIGIPFSDPIADGNTIQEAIHQSLLSGITPEQCLELSQRIRNKFPDVPLIMMTYSNILFRIGYEEFLSRAKEKGIDGCILPDIPFDESEEYVTAARKTGIATIFLTAPNTEEKRLKDINEICCGFLYVVSVFGITGERKKFDRYTYDVIKKVKKITKNKIPIAAGFGISKPEHVRNMLQAGADAVIVGSAIIRKIKETENKKKLPSILRDFTVDMKTACHEIRGK
ncbi:MAG: tryptophan synthase subunit alpha [Nitrososphaeraceae archaeon]